MEKTIEIQKKKQPVVLVVTFLLLLGTGAEWLLLRYVLPQLPGFLKFKVYAVVAVAAVILFGIILIVKQTSKKTPGLIINEQGIIDESNIASVGFVPWSDIIDIKEAANEFKHKLIVVMVRNPDVYIHKSSKMIATRQMQFHQFGSPILINTHSLECDAQELVMLLKERVVSY
jgi:hypothetical protein